MDVPNESIDAAVAYLNDCGLVIAYASDVAPEDWVDPTGPLSDIFAASHKTGSETE